VKVTGRLTHTHPSLSDSGTDVTAGQSSSAMLAVSSQRRLLPATNPIKLLSSAASEWTLLLMSDTTSSQLKGRMMVRLKARLQMPSALRLHDGITCVPSRMRSRASSVITSRMGSTTSSAIAYATCSCWAQRATEGKGSGRCVNGTPKFFLTASSTLQRFLRVATRCLETGV